MLELISKEAALRLISFPAGKKLAFLLLLYERMVPALYSFRHAEGLDVSVFQEARERFWRAPIEGAPRDSWEKLREDILNATPDSEDFGSLEASFALDAALVAADIAGFLGDGQDSHLLDAIRYALNSVGAYALEQMGVAASDHSINKFVDAHPLMLKERQKEEDDIAFLSAMPDAPWSEHTLSLLQHRAEIQGRLFDNAHKGSQA